MPKNQNPGNNKTDNLFLSIINNSSSNIYNFLSSKFLYQIKNLEKIYSTTETSLNLNNYYKYRKILPSEIKFNKKNNNNIINNSKRKNINLNKELYHLILIIL